MFHIDVGLQQEIMVVLGVPHAVASVKNTFGMLVYSREYTFQSRQTTARRPIVAAALLPDKR